MISHHAVLYPLKDLHDERKINLSYIDIDNNGLVSLSHLVSCYRVILELLCQSCMLIMRLGLYKI